MAHSDPAQIELLVLDVDGVMTDGSVLLDADGREIKRFNIRDGVGIRAWIRLGFKVAIVTGRTSQALMHRMKELGVEHVFQGSSDKAKDLEKLLHETGTDPSCAACLGDDWPDLALVRGVGYPMAVADADDWLKEAAAFVTTRPGGHAAVREAIEHLLETKGMMQEALALYDEPNTLELRERTRDTHS